MHCLYFICERKFYARKNIARHCKSTLSVYLHVETICPKIWAEPLRKNAKTEKKKPFWLMFVAQERLC